MSTTLPADDLRFDIYAAMLENNHMGIIEYMCDVPLLVAQILHGQPEEFDQEIEGAGWAGSCPDWNYGRPIVIVPHGELLDFDHLGFMAVCITES